MCSCLSEWNDIFTFIPDWKERFVAYVEAFLLALRTFLTVNVYPRSNLALGLVL